MVHLLRCVAKDSEIVTVQLQQAQHVAFWLQLDIATEVHFKKHPIETTHTTEK